MSLLPKLSVLDGEHILLKQEADSAANLPVKKELDIPDSERWCKGDFLHVKVKLG